MAQFTYVSQPPQGVFAHGQLGILLPSYHRRYLVIAYRYLTGVPLTREEASEFDPQPPPAPLQPTPVSPTPVEQWLAARKQVPGVPAVQGIAEDRAGRPPNQFQFYQNCLDDAFRNSTLTLAERIRRWGASSLAVAEWVRGQDAVFENCRDGSTIPPALTGVDPLLAADRRYQIAAAEFYSEDYAGAERDFGAVGADSASPWHDLGRLMVARTQIREATVAKDLSQLKDAAETLEAILQDPQETKWHASARGLQDFVAARIDPQARMLALGEKLMRPGDGREFSTALFDYTYLWDGTNRGPADKSDLADWITTFAGRNWSHALERWRAQPDDAWLVASLLWVPYDNAAIPDLLAAAHRVDPAAPAWPTVTFYGISRAIARGDTEAARSWADSALAIQQTPDVHNVFLAQRLKLSRGWDDFLRFTPRTPVALNYDGIDSDSPVQDGGQVVSQKTAAFDMDFTAPFNVEVPLGRWVDAASTVDLPAALRADIAQAGWVRAVVLHRPTEAQALAQRLAELRPQLRSPLQSWLAEKDADAARFKAVLLMMRTPGLQPEVRPGFGRLTADGQIDDFRDNWWTLSEPKAAEGTPAAPPDFLPEPERATGRKEWQQLLSTAAQATDYLSSETIAWARLHRDDPRVPEALHLAVRTSRYTSNATPTRFPKQAFQLLHSWYPKSTWAAQTPYWY
jgi:hypothetical protein